MIVVLNQCNGSVNGARAQGSSIHWSYFSDSVEKCIFLHDAARVLIWRQLTTSTKSTTADKSFNFWRCSSCLRLFRIIFKHGPSLATFFFLLLVCLGVEPNPGPRHLSSDARRELDSRSGFFVTTQNCRGLTDPVKLIVVYMTLFSWRAG